MEWEQPGAECKEKKGKGTIKSGLVFSLRVHIKGVGAVELYFGCVVDFLGFWCFW